MVQSLDADKGQAIVAIDLMDKTPIADYLVIVSGTSSRQVGAMAEHLMEKLKAAGVDGITAEGRTNCDWVLIDAGDVIVHLFKPEVRDFYNLEKMWDTSAVASRVATASSNEAGRVA